jgi:hypothetical protein
VITSVVRAIKRTLSVGIGTPPLSPAPVQESPPALGTLHGATI